MSRTSKWAPGPKTKTSSSSSTSGIKAIAAVSAQDMAPKARENQRTSRESAQKGMPSMLFDPLLRHFDVAVLSFNQKTSCLGSSRAARGCVSHGRPLSKASKGLISFATSCHLGSAGHDPSRSRSPLGLLPPLLKRPFKWMSCRSHFKICMASTQPTSQDSFVSRPRGEKSSSNLVAQAKKRAATKRLIALKAVRGASAASPAHLPELRAAEAVRAPKLDGWAFGDDLPQASWSLGIIILACKPGRSGERRPQTSYGNMLTPWHAGSGSKPSSQCLRRPCLGRLGTAGKKVNAGVAKSNSQRRAMSRGISS